MMNRQNKNDENIIKINDSKTNIQDELKSLNQKKNRIIEKNRFMILESPITTYDDVDDG